jgi:hypothetical protein
LFAEKLGIGILADCSATGAGDREEDGNELFTRVFYDAGHQNSNPDMIFLIKIKMKSAAH